MYTKNKIYPKHFAKPAEIMLHSLNFFNGLATQSRRLGERATINANMIADGLPWFKTRSRRMRLYRYSASFSALFIVVFNVVNDSRRFLLAILKPMNIQTKSCFSEQLTVESCPKGTVFGRCPLYHDPPHMGCFLVRKTITPPSESGALTWRNQSKLCEFIFWHYFLAFDAIFR